MKATAPSQSTEPLTALEAKVWLGAGVAVVLVALACLVFQLRLPGKAVAEVDYLAVAKVLEAERQPGDVVLLAPWWTERARIFVPDGLPVVGYQGCERDDLFVSPRIWLLAEPELPNNRLGAFMTAFAPGRTEQGAERRFGNLSLRLFTNGRARQVRFDASASLGSAQGYVEQQGQRQPIALAATWNEIFYQPRHCIRLDAPGPGQRKVAQFTNVPASRLTLFAGYIADRGVFVEGVSDAELVAEVNGERHPLPMRRGEEGLKTLDLGDIPDGSTVSVSTTAANPHERLICFELFGFGEGAMSQTSNPKLDRAIAWGLFAAGFFILLFTEKAAGFVRDESVYFFAAEQHARWFQLLWSNTSQALTDEAITRHFDFNHEHPALMKNLFGLSFVLFNEKLGWLRPAAAFRVPAFAFAALILPLTYHFIRERFGRPAGVFAAATFLLIPRQFFEAHLSCFDVPIAAMWLLVVYCFWQAMDRKRWWIYAGIAFGLALGTKHNAYFIPAALVPFSLWKGWERSKDNAEARGLFLSINGVFVFGGILYAVMAVAMGLQGVQDKFTLLSPLTGLFVIMVGVGSWLLWKLAKVHEGTFFTVAPLVAMAALGPVLFYLHWPYLWHHPVDRTAWYLAFHATHNHYAWFYLGTILRGPPFPLDYVVVKTALTVPTSLFVPMVIGFGWMLVRAVRRELTWFEGLIVINALVSIGLISLPNVPHFGGVKHWFPSMPFLGMLAAGALVMASRALLPRLKPRLASLTELHLFIALAVVCSVPAVIANARVYPYGTSHYSELAGGLPGAATMGMQRQFWANNVTGVLEWINANARQGERVYFHECHGGQINDYRRNGMLRTDLGIAGSPNDADIVAYQYHQEFREHEFDTWQAFNTQKPAFGLYVDETPQVVVYRRK